MSFNNCKLVHWIAALAIGMSSLAPSISQAIALAEGEDALVIEICSASAGNSQINLATDSYGDNAEIRDHCPYCLVHSSIIPPFKTNLKFAEPQTLALLPCLFYKSPQPLSVWITPPSAAPPRNS